MPSPTTRQADAAAFCRDILPHVSRTFALTIPVLGDPLRDHVGISYLLCRMADTIEDRPDLEPANRDALFVCLRALMDEPGSAPLLQQFDQLWPRFDDVHHESLMRRAEDVLTCYAGLPDPTRHATWVCVTDMIGGMRSYATPVAGDPEHSASTDLDTLERYCHYVAGTVGILLTRLFARELDPGWGTAETEERGRRFGLGLQLTNILKDHAADRERGVQYLPPSALERTEDGWCLSSAGKQEVVGRALEHLDAAHAYVLSLPAARTDLRLFCLWALHLALPTLQLAAHDHPRPKVSREEVAQVVETTRRAAADDAALSDLYTKARARVFDGVSTEP